MPPKLKFTREQILTASLALVRREGLEKLTARALAKELGSSPYPIFTAFENMEQVKEETLRRARKIYNHYIEEGVKSPLPFKGVGMAYIRFAKEEPELFRVFFMAGSSAPEAFREKFLELDDNREMILSLVQSVTGLEREQAEQLYQYCWLFSHSVATLFATGVCQFTEAEADEMLTDIFWGMLGRIRLKGEKK